LRHWVKTAAAGKFRGAGGTAVTPQERELSRLRAEHIRLKRELEIKKKATAFREGCTVKVAWIDAQARHSHGLRGARPWRSA